MEKEYSTSPYVDGVDGGIMCYGDGEMDRPVALVQVNAASLRKWAQENGRSDDIEKLCPDPVVEKLVLSSLLAAGKAGGLGSLEILCAIALIPGTGASVGAASATSPWTPENGCLT